MRFEKQDEFGVEFLEIDKRGVDASTRRAVWVINTDKNKLDFLPPKLRDLIPVNDKSACDEFISELTTYARENGYNQVAK